MTIEMNIMSVMSLDLSNRVVGFFWDRRCGARLHAADLEQALQEMVSAASAFSDATGTLDEVSRAAAAASPRRSGLPAAVEQLKACLQVWCPEGGLARSDFPLNQQ
jgi:hypothetical protein